MTYLEEIIKTSLIDTGIITFLVPSLLFMIITYIFLIKSKITESKIIASVSSLLVFLLVLIFPIISGIDISIFLSTFFIQFFFLSLIFLVALISSSIFYPDFLKVLERFQKSRSMIAVMVVIGLIVFITSGFLSFFLTTVGGPEITSDTESLTSFRRSPPSLEFSYTISVLIFLIIFAVILVAAGRIISKEV